MYRIFPIKSSEIDQLIECVSKILREHYSYLFNVDLRMEILSLENVDSILSYVQAFQRIRKDQKFINDGFKPTDYLE